MEAHQPIGLDPRKLATTWMPWLLLVLLGVMWGSSYLFIKKGVEVFSWQQLASLRLTIAMLSFLPFAVARRRQVNSTDLRWLALSGITGNAFPAVMFALAETQISSSLAGILSPLYPLFTMLLGAVLFGQVVTMAQGTGILLGGIGTVLLIVLGRQTEIGGNVWFAIFVVLGNISYGMSSNIVKARFQNLPALTIGAFSFLIIGIPALLILPFTGIHTVVHHPRFAEAFAYVLALSVLNTVIANVLYYGLVQIRTPLFASTVSFIIPIVALILGGSVNGETVTIWQALCLALILVGLYLAGSKPKNVTQ